MIAIPILSSFFKKMFLEKICPKVMILPHVLSWQKKAIGYDLA
jgi:hypothetical protein